MRIFLTPSAQKNLKSIPQQEQRKIVKKLLVLETNSYAGKKLAGQLKNFWSIRAWPYRILYEINEKQNRIEVHKIAHRQGTYK